MKKILVHIPKLTANYLQALLYINNLLPPDYEIRVYIPRELSNKEKYRQKQQHRERNIRFAIRNHDFLKIVNNKFINLLFGRFAKKYEEEKWLHIDNYFSTPETEKLKFKINALELNKLSQIGPRIFIELIDEINNQENKISEYSPDLFLMIGGPFVKKVIIKNLRTAINIHLGILPFYRGSKTIEWSLLNKDLQNVGVTIHFMNEEIDAGNSIRKIYFEESVKNGVGFVHARLFEMAFEQIPDIIVKVVSSPLTLCLDIAPKNRISQSGYYYGYMFNAWHCFRLIKMCEKK